MHSLGINREGELRRQLANPGSPEKMAAETECVCVCVCVTLVVWQIASLLQQHVSFLFFSFLQLIYSPHCQMHQRQNHSIGMFCTKDVPFG